MGDKCVKMRSGVDSMMNSEKGWSELKNTKFRVKKNKHLRPTSGTAGLFLDYLITDYAPV